MDQQYPTVAKTPVLDTGKFEQWQFRIQQYLQHEHYALWEVIEFGDSYVVRTNDPNITTTTSGDAGTKSRRTVTFTTEDMQRKKNDVKARTTLLLSLPDEHQLRFSKSDLDTMSLDDLYNHLKVYEAEVQKKSDPNSQNMAFISSTKHNSGNKDKNTACVSTANNIFPTASASVASISQDTACAYIASQFSGSQIKFEDINQIDEDDIEEMDIKWSMALLREDHALVADEEAPKEFELMANTSTESKKLETLKLEKDGVDGKLAGLLTASKNLDNLIDSQRLEKNKEGLRYTVVPPPTAQLYLSSKKNLSWTGLPECADNTVTNYSRPSPTVESTSEDNQNRNSSTSEDVASPITPKPFVKFVMPKDRQSESKTDKKETPKKPPVKYAEQYKKLNKKPSVRRNQRNWNNLKSYQLGPDFVMKKKACFNCGDFTHLANDCRKRVKRGTSRLKKNQEKDKIRTKLNKNGKRGEAGKNQKQLQ
nr:hypothetical protein [Tanacetum cinerariifolium]